jgi:hypothetical protein
VSRRSWDVSTRAAQFCMGKSDAGKENNRTRQKAKREGKAPTTQAREFVHEEIKHVRKGNANMACDSAKQAIAIGISKARRVGVKVPPPKKGTASESTRRQRSAIPPEGKARGKRSPPNAPMRFAARSSANRDPQLRGRHFRARRSKRRADGELRDNSSVLRRVIPVNALLLKLEGLVPASAG